MFARSCVPPFQAKHRLERAGSKSPEASRALRLCWKENEIIFRQGEKPEHARRRESRAALSSPLLSGSALFPSAHASRGSSLALLEAHRPFGSFPTGHRSPPVFQSAIKTRGNEREAEARSHGCPQRLPQRQSALVFVLFPLQLTNLTPFNIWGISPIWVFAHRV